MCPIQPRLTWCGFFRLDRIIYRVSRNGRNHSIGWRLLFLVRLSLSFLAYPICAKVYYPGGVKHAARMETSSKEKPAAASDMDIVRAKVDISVRGLAFAWVRSSFGKLAPRREKKILANVNAHFPAGKLTAVLVRAFLLFFLSITFTISILFSCRAPAERGNRHCCSFLLPDT